MKKMIRLLALALVSVMVCLSLTSCGGPNSDPDKALESLKDNGITWAAKDDTITPAALKAFDVNGVECVVAGTGKIDDEFALITIIYFESAEAAAEALTGAENYADDRKSRVDESKWVFEQSGKMIYFGHKDAIKAAQ